MTELAYLANMDEAYRRTFSATVQALPPGAVVLDRTWFYPAGGGQPGDRGTLLVDGTSVPVVDVAKSAGAVLHRLGRGTSGRAPGLRVGATVEGVIDWERRQRHMRLHTAQHLVSAEIFTATGVRTRRATMAGTEGIVELEAPWPADRPWETLVTTVAAAVRAARPVAVQWVPRAEWDQAPAARSGLVALPPNVDPVRVIGIDGHDRCPCGGTHARNTAELGPIELPVPTGTTVVLRIAPVGPPTPPA